MKPQVLEDGPLKGQTLETDTHVFTMKGVTGAYRFRHTKESFPNRVLLWVPV